MPPTPPPLPTAPPAAGSDALTTTLAEVDASTKQVYVTAYETRKNLRKSINTGSKIDFRLEEISNKLEILINKI